MEFKEFHLNYQNYINNTIILNLTLDFHNPIYYLAYLLEEAILELLFFYLFLLTFFCKSIDIFSLEKLK
jgi:hypothetical protein